MKLPSRPTFYRFTFFLAIFVCWLAVTKPSYAEANLELMGELIQGALVQGRVSPGASVKVLDREPFIDSRGGFVFGLGRDAPDELTITTVSASGEATKHTFTVKQREYKTQRIEGVEQKYVEPPAEVLARIKQENASVWQAR